jgi:hypothetical protein
MKTRIVGDPGRDGEDREKEEKFLCRVGKEGGRSEITLRERHPSSHTV